TLQAYWGNLYINDFVKFGRVYRVQTESEPQYRSAPGDIAKIYVRAQNGQGSSMIPLDTVVTTEYTSGPDPVTHFLGYNTALALGAEAPGASSGQAIEALDRAAREVLVPKGYALVWSGISYQERQVGNQSVMAFILGVMPMVLATGAGAASRRSIGTGVFGGMLAATFLAIFFVPLFFVVIRKFSHRITKRPTPTPPVEPSESEPKEEYQHV